MKELLTFLRGRAPHFGAWILLFGAGYVQGAPQVLRVDGAVYDSTGLPLTGTRDLQLRAYDAASGGTLLWTSAVSTPALVAGRFSVLLDANSGSPSLAQQVAALGASAAPWFEIDYDTGAANGTMNSAVTVRPRLRARGTLFAAVAASAGSLHGVTATSTEMNYLNGLTGNVQAQINNAGGSGPSNLKYGGGGWRSAPTSGTLTGEYWTSGAWATTGTIACNRCRLYFDGTVSIGHAITIATEAASGQGFGGGGSATGSGGGGFGGAGGTGAGAATGGSSYPVEWALFGSGGGGGAAGGAGGGSFYLEALGNVSIGANIAASGGAGGVAGNAGGGGGSGGGIDIRSLGSVTVSSGVTVSANGGAGGSTAFYGGGGGGGGYVQIRGATVTVTGATLQASGGAAGTGAAPGAAGTAGVTSAVSTIYGPRY